MSDERPTVDSVVRDIPLSDLADPRHDVRDRRDPDQLRNLAQSMDQHGQRVPLDCWLDAEFLPDDTAKVDTADLETLVDQADAVRITDGLSRKAAAEQLGWPTLRCEVSRNPPADETIAQLAANTDRLDMGEYESVSALKEYQERTGITQSELADLAGMSQPYLSQLLGALEEPDPIVEAWRNPETHIETGHVLEIRRLPDLESKQLVFNSVMSHDQGVSATRTKVDNRIKEAKKEGPTPETVERDRKDGYGEDPDPERDRPTPVENQPDTCVFCGELAEVRDTFAFCEQDYQAVRQARDEGRPIMPAPDDGQAPPEATDDAHAGQHRR